MAIARRPRAAALPPNVVPLFPSVPVVTPREWMRTFEGHNNIKSFVLNCDWYEPELPIGVRIGVDVERTPRGGQWVAVEGQIRPGFDGEGGFLRWPSSGRLPDGVALVGVVVCRGDTRDGLW